MRFATSNGFAESDQFFTHLGDTFDTLYREGQAGQPKMMSKPSVWFAKREQIVRHWRTCHPPTVEA